jgi:hypothetical protein
VLLSLAVAFVGTVMISGTILKGSLLFIHPPDYHDPWHGMLTPTILFGSLVLSPILFALCYHLLSRTHGTPSRT